MNQLTTFRYYFLDAGNLYYTVNDNIAALTPIKSKLRQDPDGWSEAQLRISRNERYMGLFRSYSTPLKFHGDAAIIIKQIYRYAGYEGYLRIEIEKIDPVTLLYSEYFTGDIDFSQIEIDRDFVTVNIIEGGLSALIKSREALTYEIPLNQPEAVTVNIDGIKLRNRVTFTVGMSLNPADNVNEGHSPQITEVYREAETNNDIQSPEYTPGGAANVYSNERWFYKASTNGLVTITYDFSLDVVELGGIGYTASTFICAFVKRDTSNNNTLNYLVNDNNYINFLNTLFVLQGSVSINCNVGDEIYLLSYLSPGTDAGFDYNTSPLVAGTIKISFTARYPATESKAYRYVDLYKRLIAKVTDGLYVGQSDFLSNQAATYTSNYDNIPYRTVVTSGDGIRGLSSSVIKTSLNDLFKDCRRWGLGLGIVNNIVRLEPLAFFFDKNTPVYQIGSINNLKVKNASQFYGKELKFGYSAVDNDMLNGKDEFNTEVNYSIDGIRVKESLDWLSPYHASMYAIENIRKELYRKETVDASTDNQTYLIEIEGSATSGKFNVSRHISISQISGVIDAETAYNFGLSPKRTLYRNIPWLQSIMNIPVQQTLQYQSSSKNKDVYAGGVYEAGVFSILLPQGVQLFDDKIVDFDCELSDNFLAAVNSNPRGYIIVKDGAFDFNIFILDIADNAGKKDKVTVTGLLYPNTPLNKVII